MTKLISASCLLLLLAGCQNSQAPNPFAMYGPQRLPPPGTQTYGQPASTAPYYQGPAANSAPSLQPGAQQGVGQPPAQFSPPASSYPAPQGTPGPASNYQQGQWRGVSQSSGSSDVVPASYTEEISSQSHAANSSPKSSADDSGLGLRGMRVNEVTEVSPPLSPPPTATAPSSDWTSMSQPAAPTSSSPAVPQPSRIP